MAIVLDLEQLQPAVLDRDLNRGRSSIERVFNEFFKSVGWSVDNLCPVVGRERPTPSVIRKVISHKFLLLFSLPREV